MNSNRLTLKLADNEELKAALANKAPGDTVTLEVEAQIDEVGPAAGQFSVLSAELIEETADSETPDEESSEGKGDSEDAAAAIFGMPKKKGGS